MAPSTFSLKQLVLLSTLICVLTCGSSAAPDRSLSESDVEIAEARLTVTRVTEENQELKEKLALAEAANAKLTESLAIATGEAEVFRRQMAEMKLRMEALGLDGAGGNASAFQERFAKALNNLRLAEDEKKRLAVALISLNDAVNRFVKSATQADAQVRLDLEAQMRAASDALGNGTPSAIDATAEDPTLTDGLIISVNEQLGPLVVGNIGSKHGVKVGMPFQVIRGDQLVATLRVIDVRERICGAVIQNLEAEKDKIKVGDRLRVAAQL